jgi:hypothetical protein
MHWTFKGPVAVRRSLPMADRRASKVWLLHLHREWILTEQGTRGSRGKTQASPSAISALENILAAVDHLVVRPRAWVSRWSDEVACFVRLLQHGCQHGAPGIAAIPPLSLGATIRECRNDFLDCRGAAGLVLVESTVMRGQVQERP